MLIGLKLTEKNNLNALIKMLPESLLENSPILMLSLGAIFNILQTLNKALSLKALSKTILLSSLCLALLFSLYLYSSSLTQDACLNYIIQSLLISMALILSLLATNSYLDSQIFKGEVASLLQLSLIGMITFTINDNLCAVTLGLEILLLAMYSLSVQIKPNHFSQEGALKFFILGTFASSIFIFGLGMLYASTGKLQLSTMIDTLNETSHLLLWAKIGAIGIIVGLAFKLSLFPFNLWAPDYNEASPTMITAYMIIGFKVFAMGTIIKVFAFGIPLEGSWTHIVTIISGASILFGTILALVQTSVKRILAYVAISHSGHLTMMIGSLTTHTYAGSKSIIFYLISYALTSLLAFGILMSLEDEKRQNICIDDLRGLNKNKPWYALGLTIAIFSYAGLPPTAGFISKLLIFSSALSKHQIVLAMIAAICNVIALVFYLRIITYMYMEDAQSSQEFKPKPSIVRNMVLISISSTTILLGTILPGKIFDLITPMIKSKLSIP